jgi:hypothetical protein
MAKGSHRRPAKRKRTVRKTTDNEARNQQRVKDRKRQSRKSKLLIRQMRGMKWNEEEYSDGFEEELEDV